MTDATKTVYPKIGVWYGDDGSIHLSIEGKYLSTVSPDSASKRGNPHLFNKLAMVLRDSGVPHPPIK
jgi:hypothetical protein